ncbi:hypothetical protein BGZ96_003634 [Linnemannia gamsii]|uniref:Uncharacterized protein n=1 Tax=Linnemannia gamsii TaxID=64522 RepID=A0ABQ7KI97_9FUNG|nr:hypothetical protein BGZ96_003634 [Linnemannia gamsii]
MHFKTTIIAALLIGLTLAAPHPDIAAEPEAVAVAVVEPQASNAAEPQAGAGMQKEGVVEDVLDPNNLSIIGNVAWPIPFNRQCNTLAAITASLDKQLAYAKARKNYSCTKAQAAVIAQTSTCPVFNIVLTLLWPIAFTQQENLTARIAAQVECLGAYHQNNC